ncbi:PRC-barrel domain-containing protein [Hoeflea sp. BAL378]|uniref:PRC-barrel domain-containing protein n=1 Tax=Hoeflea sp. BAL378 TaxID=1547437 RepID=UPI0006900DFE|nr:PRC-barrel domain-containing protein [Hoeflea sp. BAL378]
MYVSFTDLRNAGLVNGDTGLGDLTDLYIDERTWLTDYIVIDTGGWFSSHAVLVAPDRITSVEPENRALTTGLTREDLEGAPAASTEKTVGDVVGAEWMVAAGQPFYAAAGYMAVLPPAIPRRPAAGAAGEAEAVADGEEVHLRSAREILGYGIEAADGKIGSVSDLILDPKDFRVALIAVDTGNWLPGRVVVLDPKWARSVSWTDRTVSFDKTRQEIEDAPALAELSGLERSYEAELYRYYGYPMM